MLALALLTVLTGGRARVDMEDFGREREPWLREFPTPGNGTPSHDTFSRLFRKLDPANPRRALPHLTWDWADEHGDMAAVVREGLGAFADAPAAGVRGGVEVDASAGEGGRQVERDPGAAGTGGAAGREGARGDRRRMYAQRGSTAAIVAKGGDHALQLKRNQDTMREDVVEYLDNPPKPAELLSHQQLDKAAGAREAHL